jgi:D-alanyl-D-alanine dipeptidase/CubicO group peptidase (beta-lactamase class C family)
MTRNSRNASRTVILSAKLLAIASIAIAPAWVEPSIAATLVANPATPGDAQWELLGQRLLSVAEQERTAQDIPSISIGIVDRSGLVWSGSVGFSDAAKTRAADSRTLYRIGVLNLDASVQTYLPDFKPTNPFGVPITLRQLMGHRSGLVREPPRGNYFDTQPATLQETVASLNVTTLVAAPGSIYKYSNAGIAVVGRVLEVVARKPFEQVIAESVLQHLDMADTALRATTAVRKQLAFAQLAPFDTERFEAPTFDLGTAPAGNVYSNIQDLGRVAAAILNGGSSIHGQILHPATLESMWQQQGASNPAGGYGIGFNVGAIDGHRVVGHTGAVYGYVTDLSILPDDGVAVIVTVALDQSRALGRIRSFAVREVLAAKAGESPPHYNVSEAIPVSLARELEGHYSDGTNSLDVRLVDGHTYVEAPDAAAELRRQGNRWVLDDVTTYREDIYVDPVAHTVRLGDAIFKRAEWTQPPPPSPDIARLIGEYGWEHNAVRVYERDGKPYARVEWSTYVPLERVSQNVYRLADTHGLYPLEQLRFDCRPQGLCQNVSLNGIVFERRDFGAELDAKTRAIVKGSSDLRQRALRATPPVSAPGLRTPELVDLSTIETGFKLQIGYATNDNFLGRPVYEQARAFLQKPAAEALARAHRELLANHGFGILIHDAYRPWFVTWMFWEATPSAGRAYVADPSQGSRHNRGCATDITLYDSHTGKMLEMPGRYDEMSARSSPLYLGGSSEQRWRRDLLKHVTEAEGFAVYRYEWWHFDYESWATYPILNVEFNKIPKPTT